ncbi:hypothetical protein GCM10009554_68490 [Kribbella koreensis]|uniref:WD40 repeat protein n=1 Tax=Kribbella koreensis TaxID=57909 RepID=A0ABN1RHW0_9ACTN
MSRRKGRLPRPVLADRERRVPRVVLVGALLAATAGLSATLLPPAGAVSPGHTEVVSVGADSNDSVGAASAPAISADGQQIAFESRAALDPAVRPTANPPSNVYVRDRRAPGRTILISRGLPMTSLTFSRGNSAPRRAAAPLEEGGNADSRHPTLSANGRYIAFASEATNLQDGYPATGGRVVLCDRDPDGDGTFDEQRPNGTMDYLYLYVGRPPTGNGPTGGTEPSLSADAGVIAWLEQPPFTTRSTLVVARLIKDVAGRIAAPRPDTFLRSSLEDVGHTSPQVSANGQQVAFATDDCETALICPDGSQTIEVFAPGTGQTSRVDVLPSGEYSGKADLPSISGTGRFIAYEHRLGVSGPMVAVVVDRDPAATGTLGPAPGVPVAASIASRDIEGQEQEGLTPALSSDGRYLAFASSADGMHDDAQGTGRQAVVLRDLVLDAGREQAGLPRLAGELGSPAADPDCAGMVCPATGPSGSPRLAANGSVVVFSSAGDDLLPDPCCVGAVFARVLQPRIEKSTTDFGPVELGASVGRTVVLRHSGFGPLLIEGLSLAGPDASDFSLTGAENCGGATLNPGETCSVAVSFTPTAAGVKQAILRIGRPGEVPDEVQLVAEGIEFPVLEPPGPPGPPEPPTQGPSGQLVVSPDPLDFGGSRPALVTLPPQTVQVRNAATVAITVVSVGVLEGPRFTIGDFAISANTCSGTLAPGASCSIVMAATPQNSGQRVGVLAITTADPAYSRLIALRSTAIQPVLQVNPGVVRMNRVASVTGQNFPPGKAVTLTLTTPGTRLLLNTVAQPDGTFSAALVVFPQTSTGTWPVLASVGGTLVRAQAPVLLVPGSYQPPGFTSRR